MPPYPEPFIWVALCIPHPSACAQVPTPEASPRGLKLLRQHSTPLMPPLPASSPSEDVEAHILPVPSPRAHPGELSILDALSKARNHPISKAPERVPEELGAMANESTVALSTLGTDVSDTSTPGTDASDTSSLGTSSPLCPGDEEPAETCGVPTREQRAAMAEALGTFALHFYQHIAEAAQPDASLVFSPITVAMGLSHLLLGEALPASTATGTVLGTAVGTTMGTVGIAVGTAMGSAVGDAVTSTVGIFVGTVMGSALASL